MPQPKAYPPTPAQKIAFIGLGVMGAPMAGHLAAGHRLTVYNRTAGRADAWVKQYGGRAAPSPRQASEDCDLVFTCVGNDGDLRSVTLGPGGAVAGMKPGAILTDHSTVSAEMARELHGAAKERGLHFIDAPVSGGQSGAQNGVLTVMCGGDAEPFEAMRAAAMAYARAVTLLGPAGSGQLAKMVNQICIAGLLQGLSEGIAFGQRAGLDMPKVLDVIGKGAASSWQMENRGAAMIDDRFDFGFAVDWMRKDLGIALAEARKNGAQLPAACLIDQFYGEIQAMGGGRLDTSSLIKRLR